MASTAIIASLHISCSSNHVTKKQQPQSGSARSLGPTQSTFVVTPDFKGQKGFNVAEHHGNTAIHVDKSKEAKDNQLENGLDSEPSFPKFTDERWKNGTWDLNMFVKVGKIDWDGVIIAGNDPSPPFMSRKDNYGFSRY